MSAAGYDDEIAEVNRRDRVRLAALEREQAMTTAPCTRKSAHRLVPIPRELHEPGGATRWKCVGCGATYGFVDESDDVDCTAMALFR